MILDHLIWIYFNINYQKIKKISLKIRIKRKCQLLNITIKLLQLIIDISVFQSGSWEATLLFLVFPCPNTPWIKWVGRYLTSAEFDDGLIIWIRCVEAWKHLQRARQRGGLPGPGPKYTNVNNQLGKSCSNESDISRVPSGDFSKLGANVHLDTDKCLDIMMKLWHFISKRSKIKVTVASWHLIINHTEGLNW